MRYLLAIIALPILAQSPPNCASVPGPGACNTCAAFSVPTNKVCFKEHCSIAEDDTATYIQVPASVSLQYQDNSPSTITGGDGVASVCNGTQCSVKVQGAETGTGAYALIRGYTGTPGNGQVPLWTDNLYLANFGSGSGVSTPIIDANSNTWVATPCAPANCGGTPGVALIRFGPTGTVLSTGCVQEPILAGGQGGAASADSILVSPDGTMLAVLSGPQGPVTLWNSATGTPIVPKSPSENPLYPTSGTAGSGTAASFASNTNSAGSVVVNGGWHIFYVGQQVTIPTSCTGQMPPCNSGGQIPATQPNGYEIAILANSNGLIEDYVSPAFFGPSQASPMIHGGQVFTDIGSCPTSGGPVTYQCGGSRAGTPGIGSWSTSNLANIYNATTSYPTAANFPWIASLGCSMNHQKNTDAFLCRNPTTGSTSVGGYYIDVSNIAIQCAGSCRPSSDVTMTTNSLGDDVAISTYEQGSSTLSTLAAFDVTLACASVTPGGGNCVVCGLASGCPVGSVAPIWQYNLPGTPVGGSIQTSASGQFPLNIGINGVSQIFFAMKANANTPPPAGPVMLSAPIPNPSGQCALAGQVRLSGQVKCTP